MTYYTFLARGTSTEKPANSNQVTVEGIIELPDDEPVVLAAGHIKTALPAGINIVVQVRVELSGREVWDQWEARPDVYHRTHAHYEVNEGWSQ
jgi:hypothetical protein